MQSAPVLRAGVDDDRNHAQSVIHEVSCRSHERADIFTPRELGLLLAEASHDEDVVHFHGMSPARRAALVHALHRPLSPGCV